MGKDNIQSLQVLRGFAALAVVIHHSIRAVTINNGELVFSPAWFINNHTIMDVGAAGVDIFFILSGFLMLYISNKYTKESFSFVTFLKHRFIRVWPLYAIVTMLLCLILLIQFIHLGRFSFDLQLHRLASLFFIPSFNESGILQPILGVGWTLNYEVFFYIVFAISLKISVKNTLPYVGMILLFFFVVGTALPQKTVAHAFLSNTIIFEFLFGVLICYAYMSGYLLLKNSLPVLILGLLIIVVSSMYNVSENLRFITTGVGAALIFIGMLTLKQTIKFPPYLVILGDASYSIYLVHILVIYEVFFRVLYKAPSALLSNINAEIMALLMIVCSLFIGVLFYYFVEKPILNFFRR
ncbi:hypothetical protein CBX96_08605 [Shewanella sp. BC20]|uniref:acyltransferase family protein n=1 Tax=Shewanella sp. BC20 TaxID=2004459 RepID=UPI000D65BBBB|nr:acyltransferase [Shewanella sp. BC20]PWF63884.1 hypothetical protein CBX96_08605 [Shewanella sp. BC20]